METILRHLMNCGFVVREMDYDVPKFAIEKIATPADERVPANFSDGIFNVSYDTFELAVKKAQQLSGWEPEAQVWNIQIMYQHRGRGSLLADLAPVVSHSYETALAEAKCKGEQFISQTFAEGDIQKWEVKVRPCGILREPKTIR